MSYPVTLDDRAHEIHELMVSRGMYDHAVLTVPLPEDPSEPRYASQRRIKVANPSFDAERLVFIHSEVDEALNAHRDGDDDALGLELADILLRTLDYAAYKGLSMDNYVPRKMAIVRERLDQRPASPAAASLRQVS